MMDDSHKTPLERKSVQFLVKCKGKIRKVRLGFEPKNAIMKVGKEENNHENSGFKMETN